MAYEQRENSGTLFRNEKGDNPKRPDYRGEALVDGVEYRVSAWVKDGKKGKFLSMAFDAKEAPAQTQDAETYNGDNDDNLPF